MKALVLAYIFALSFISCKTVANDGTSSSSGGDHYVETLERIEWGQHFGECIGDCITTYELRQNAFPVRTVIVTKTKMKYGATEADSIQSTSAVASPVQFRKLLGLAQLSTLKQLKTVYGCPGCADGPIHWLKVTGKAGTTYLIKYESVNVLRDEILKEPKLVWLYNESIEPLLNELKVLEEKVSQ